MREKELGNAVVEAGLFSMERRSCAELLGFGEENKEGRDGFWAQRLEDIEGRDSSAVEAGASWVLVGAGEGADVVVGGRKA
jgi:hypothetical protein